jgi:hypothetical protein
MNLGNRCAMLSAGGDVFLSEMVLNFWKERWYDEIDTMYIGYNNHAEVPLDIAYEFLRKWEKDPKVRIIYTPHGVGNGTPITQMLLNSKETNLLLLEDDSFVFTPGVVEGWFNLIETGVADIVGSPRYSVGEVAENAKRKYDLDYSGMGDRGFGWWPSFFLCKRYDLLKTDLDFGSKKYPKGEYFKEVDHTFVEDSYTDTFTWASLQLRYMNLRSHDIAQNHAHPFDWEYQHTKQVMFANGNPEYIHGGSLSSGWGGYLNKKLPPVTNEMELKDIETRVAFWTIAKDMTSGYSGFRNEYHQAIRALISNAKLDKQRINDKYNLYRQLMHI